MNVSTCHSLKTFWPWSISTRGMIKIITVPQQRRDETVFPERDGREEQKIKWNEEGWREVKSSARALRSLRSVEWDGFNFFLSSFPSANDLKLNDFIPQECSTVNRTLLKSKFRISPMIAVKGSWISIELFYWGLFLHSIRKITVFESTVSHKLIANFWSPLSCVNFQDIKSKQIFSRCMYLFESLYTKSSGGVIRKCV